MRVNDAFLFILSIAALIIGTSVAAVTYREGSVTWQSLCYAGLAIIFLALRLLLDAT